MTTLLHSYRLVAANLYRMQDRSTLAENAWDAATADDIADPLVLCQTSVLKINAARNKAIASIADDCPSGSKRAFAIVAIDEAVRSAVAMDLLQTVDTRIVEVVTG